MASKVIEVNEEPRVILILVKHGMHDSFSRSVRRAANKAWRGFPNSTRIRTSYTEASFGYWSDPAADQVLSLVAYGPSFDEIRVASRRFLEDRNYQP